MSNPDTNKNSGSSYFQPLDESNVMAGGLGHASHDQICRGTDDRAATPDAGTEAQGNDACLGREVKSISHQGDNRDHCGCVWNVGQDGTHGTANPEEEGYGLSLIESFG